MDAEEQAMVQQAAEASAMPSGPSAAPDVDEGPPPPLPGGPPGAISEVDMEQDMEQDEDEDLPMRVVKNYTRADPRAASARLANGQVRDQCDKCVINVVSV
jgi:hypothetical protein